MDKRISLALVVTGAILLFFGFNAYRSAGSDLSPVIYGRTDR